MYGLGQLCGALGARQRQGVNASDAVCVSGLRQEDFNGPTLF
jgi:hypothetical protein